METTNIIDFARRDGMTDALTELLRTGAQELIATAVEAELASYLAQFADVRTDAGHAAVVRNGHHELLSFSSTETIRELHQARPYLSSNRAISSSPR